MYLNGAFSKWINPKQHTNMGTIRLFYLSFLLFGLSLLPLQAQDTLMIEEGEDLTLSQAIRIGLENNFQIKIAENNLEIARNENDEGFAGFYPDINATFNFNNGYINTQRAASFLEVLTAGNTTLIPGVEAVWTLFDGGRIRLTKQQLEQLELQSEGQVRIAVENTIEAIILAYYQVLLREEGLEVLEEVLQLSRDRIEYEEVKQEFGQASTFDILQTREAYLNDSTDYITSMTGYRNAMHTLNQAMGVQSLGRTYNLVDSLIIEEPVYGLDNLRTEMLSNNNQLRNLYVQRELSKINTQLEESERLPQINLRTGANYNWEQTLFGTGTFADGREQNLDGNLNKTLNGFVNFSATYNIFNGGRRNINIQNAKIQELNAQLDVEQTKLDLNTQLENTYITYTNQRQLIQVTTDRLDNARRNLEIAEERFRGGLINSFDYRQIQLQFINASQARLQAIFDFKQTETRLRKLVGDLVR